MSEVSERYRNVADGFELRLIGADQEQWSAPSPCDDWTAEQIVDHVIETHRRVYATLQGTGTEPEPLGAHSDRLRSWSDARSQVQEAVEDKEQAERTISGMFGEQSFESLVGRLLCTDTLIHTWDLARATGQSERLNEGAVASALEFLTPIDDAIRRPGGFAPKIEPPADADVQTRLLNFAGREC